MPKATAEQTRKANRAAVVVAIIVALFAATFIGTVLALDSIATEREQDEVVIADQSPINTFYVLLIGSDTRKGTALYNGKANEHAQVDQHSDVMTLMRVDPRKYTVSLLTIPRDTVIQKDGVKINNALLENDPEKVVDAVYELTGLRADYYMLTTFGNFESFIDALGGVTIDVPLDVSANDPATGGTLTVKAGKQKHLTGAEALVVARARSEYVVDQDAYRQLIVRSLEEAIINSVLESDSIGIEALLVALGSGVDTNMDISVLGQTVLDFLSNSDKVTIYTGTGPYEGAQRESDGQWVIENDTDTWEEVMAAFKRGKDFSNIVKAPTVEQLEQLKPSESSASAASSSAASASSAASSSSNAASKSSSSTSKSSKSSSSSSTSSSSSSSSSSKSS